MLSETSLPTEARGRLKDAVRTSPPPRPPEASGGCRGCCQKLSHVLQRPEGGVTDAVRNSPVLQQPEGGVKDAVRNSPLSYRGQREV